jgi:hypothetical protein
MDELTVNDQFLWLEENISKLTSKHNTLPFILHH